MGQKGLHTWQKGPLNKCINRLIKKGQFHATWWPFIYQSQQNKRKTLNPNLVKQINVKSTTNL
jgi:hypothetical protein